MRTEEINKIEKDLVYNICLEEVMELGIARETSFNTILLASAVLGRVRHPEQPLAEILQKAMKNMPKRYSKKRNILSVSANKLEEQLEIAIDSAHNIPSEWMNGEIVETTLNKLSKKVISQLEENFAD